MSDTIPRYPLEWPAGWKRTPAYQRRRAPFHKIVRRPSTLAAGTFYKEKESLTIADGLDRLEGELRRMGAQNVVVSTNLAVNQSGRPYTKQAKMQADPGVAVYFRLKGRALALACDAWQSVAENMAALAGHIEAIRACDRYGVGTIEQAFAGYKALPADTAADWRQVLGFGPAELVSPNVVVQRFKQLSHRTHPDKGGTEAAQAHLNRARDFALAELSPAHAE